MTNYSINPSDLLKAAEDFDLGGKDLMEILQRLDSSCELLEENWSGASRQVFMQNYQEARKYFEILNMLIKKVSVELSEMASRISVADQ